MNLPLQGDTGDLPNSKVVLRVGTSRAVETHVFPEERNPCWERVLNVPCTSVTPGSELTPDNGFVEVSVVNVASGRDSVIMAGKIPLRVRVHCMFLLHSLWVMKPRGGCCQQLLECLLFCCTACKYWGAPYPLRCFVTPAHLRISVAV